jgi:hypothetical protein
MKPKVALVAVAGALAVTGVAVIGFDWSQPVHAAHVSCDTGTGVRCSATLVNENDDTGYSLAVRLIGYDEDGTVVSTYTNDATGDGGGIASVPPGGTENISISTSASERVVTADVRVVDVQASED